MHTISPQTHILFVMPRSKKGLGRCHKRVDGKRLLEITGALITMTVTQRASICHYRWYLFLFHWIIQSSIHLRCRRFVNTQRAMSFNHQWYLSFPHRIIHSLIQLNCPWFVNSHTALNLTQRMICKLLQYPVGLLLIRQIPCHCRPTMMEITIFMESWLMCLNWYRNNVNNIT